MSPEMRKDFEAEWPLLARRLNAFLGRKQIGPDQREDLVQETALRLYGAWERVDRSRSAWALTATIALNLIRDQGRRYQQSSLPVAEVPEPTCSDDVEQIALARVELGRVNAALAEMTPAQRSVLLEEVGSANGSAATPATKMRRLRARRKLRQMLERSMAVVLPFRRVTEVGQAVTIFRDSFARVGSCLACMVLGVGSFMGLPPEALVEEPVPDFRTEAPIVGLGTPGPLSEVDDVGSTSDASDRTPRTGSRFTRASASEGDSANAGAPTQLPIPHQVPDGLSTTDAPTERPVPLPSVPPAPGSEPGDDAPSVDEVVREVYDELDEVVHG